MADQTAEKDAPDWEARAVVAEAALAQIKDMWSEERWLQFSMSALHQIRDRVLGVIESTRVLPPEMRGQDQ